MASLESNEVMASGAVEEVCGVAPDPLANAELGSAVDDGKASEEPSPVSAPASPSGNAPTIVLPQIPGLPINLPPVQIPEDLKSILAHQETLQKLSSKCLEKTQQLFNEPTVRQLREELYMALPESVKKTHADVIKAYEQGGVLKLVELACQLSVPVIQQLAQKIVELCLWLAEHREEIAGALASVYQTVRNIVLQLQYRLMTEVMNNAQSMNSLRSEKPKLAMSFLPAFASSSSDAAAPRRVPTHVSALKPSAAGSKDLHVGSAQPAGVMYSSRVVPQYAYSYGPVLPRQGASVVTSVSSRPRTRQVVAGGVREARKAGVLDVAATPAGKQIFSAASVSSFFSSLFGQKGPEPVPMSASCVASAYPITYQPSAGTVVQPVAKSSVAVVSGYPAGSYAFQYKGNAPCVTCGQPLPNRVHGVSSAAPGNAGAGVGKMAPEIPFSESRGAVAKGEVSGVVMAAPEPAQVETPAN
uniref:Uncharacterized protein n=1 Tax=Neospora caninum (strain Liverpool) TaxID=572307 RepID=F0JB91_NEOCL|nr:hypothetical protein, conserved [Neospora caninum Liverpool]CEL71358.1 TPA: hypothetical protein, conserved [Neospora caninum Liverpool]